MRLEKAIREFLSFLRLPIFDYPREKPLDFTIVIRLYLIVFLVEMLLFVPISSFFDLENIPHVMKEILDTNSLLEVFVKAVIIAPIIEEFLFRFHLRYGNFIYLFLLFLAVSVVGFAVATMTTVSFDGFESIVQWAKEHPIWIAPIICFGIGLIIFLKEQDRNREHRAVKRFFPYIFYLTAFIFAMLHVSNFTLDKSMWLMAPLLVLPQFILGLYLGYIRMRNNLGYSIFIHAFNNAIPLFLIALGTLSGGS